jgi:hypothetical protein
VSDWTCTVGEEQGLTLEFMGDRGDGSSFPSSHVGLDGSFSKRKGNSSKDIGRPGWAMTLTDSWIEQIKAVINQSDTRNLFQMSQIRSANRTESHFVFFVNPSVLRYPGLGMMMMRTHPSLANRMHTKELTDSGLCNHTCSHRLR